jgi:hypothetical protein
MGPELSGFALGLLFGAAKIGAIGTVVFAIAWWRARREVRTLEAERNRPAVTDERLQQLEQGIEYLASRLDRLVEGQEEVRRQLGARARPAELPGRGDPITPH